MYYFRLQAVDVNANSVAGNVSKKGVGLWNFERDLHLAVVHFLKTFSLCSSSTSTESEVVRRKRIFNSLSNEVAQSEQLRQKA